MIQILQEKPKMKGLARRMRKFFFFFSSSSFGLLILSQVIPKGFEVIF